MKAPIVVLASILASVSASALLAQSTNYPPLIEYLMPLDDVAALAASNSWATKSPIPASHLFAKAGAINGIIYVVGGENSSSQSISTVRAYNIASNIWSIKASLHFSSDSCRF